MRAAYVAAMAIHLIDDLPPVDFIRSARARRLSLRWLPVDGRFRLTLPARLREADAVRFLNQQTAWMERQARLRPAMQPIPFMVGSVVPVFGQNLTIIAADKGRSAEIKDGAIHVAGAADLHAARIRRTLAAAARDRLHQMATEKANLIGRPIRAVTVRDMRSRWGSCAINGDLSFNWRLIFAPLEIADYVAAHEVAHLAHHDHSPRFWDLCFKLASAPAFARDWLKREGSSLFRFGADA